MHQVVAEEEGKIGGAGGMRDGVAPGKAAFIENALGESVGGRRVQQIPVELLNELLVLAANQRGHRGIGGKVGVDHWLLQPRPADGAFGKPPPCRSRTSASNAPTRASSAANNSVGQS